MSDRLYVRHDVLRRLSEREAVVYRCLEVLPERRFVVQSADRVRISRSVDGLLEHEKQFWELFCEIAPEERSSLHPTLEEAIAAFDQYFESEDC